jgi:hydroxymethylbilane synthase
MEFSELWRALLEARLDVAIFVASKWPIALPDGVTVAAVCGRAEPLDAFVVRAPYVWATLPTRARVHACGAARRAQLLRNRPDLELVPFGDAVVQHPHSWSPGVLAAVLPLSGLDAEPPDGCTVELSAPELLLPEPGQGVLGAVIRANDSESLSGVRVALHDPGAAACLAAEAGFVAGLCCGEGASVAALATWSGVGEGSYRWMELTGLVLTPDGSQLIEGVASERIEDEDQATELGRSLAGDLITQGALELLGSSGGL